MPIISGLEAMSVAAVLAKAGARWTPFFRQATDANGVATGTTVRAGCILGRTYVKGQTSNLRIEVPGVIVNQEVTRFEGVLASDGNEPKVGDLICIDGVAGERAKITCVNAEARPLVVLTLDR